MIVHSDSEPADPLSPMLFFSLRGSRLFDDATAISPDISVSLSIPLSNTSCFGRTSLICSFSSLSMYPYALMLSVPNIMEITSSIAVIFSLLTFTPENVIFLSPFSKMQESTTHCCAFFRKCFLTAITAIRHTTIPKTTAENTMNTDNSANLFSSLTTGISE